MTRGPGRPPASAPALTLKCIDAICAAYEIEGTTLKRAYLEGPIAERTGKKWLERGEALFAEGDTESLEVQFYLRIERIRGDRVRGLYSTSVTAEGPAAASARWWAERCDPKSLHLAAKLEHSGPEGAPIELKDTTPDGLADRLAAAIARLAGGAAGAGAPGGTPPAEPRRPGGD